MRAGLLAGDGPATGRALTAVAEQVGHVIAVSVAASPFNVRVEFHPQPVILSLRDCGGVVIFQPHPYNGDGAPQRLIAQQVTDCALAPFSTGQRWNVVAD